MEKKPDYFEIDVLRLLTAIWQRIWLVILAAVLCGAIAFSYASFLVTPLYDSSALMYVNNSSFSLGSTSFSISSAELSAAQSLVDTYIVILKTRTTLLDVIEKADLDYSYETLSNMISASAVNGTEIFKISVTSDDPQEAEKIANTIANILPQKISGIVDGSSVRIVDYAVVPSQKASPNITRYTAIGLIIGIALSCLWIVVAELLDDLVHGIDALPNHENIPVLAEIPDLEESHRSKGYYSYYKSKGSYAYAKNKESYEVEVKDQ